jgi:hypothetical protein
MKKKLIAEVVCGGECQSDPSIYKFKIKTDKKTGVYRSAKLEGMSVIDHGNGVVINSGPYSLSLDYSQIELLEVLMQTYNKFDLFPRDIEIYEK